MLYNSCLITAEYICYYAWKHWRQIKHMDSTYLFPCICILSSSCQQMLCFTSCTVQKWRQGGLVLGAKLFRAPQLSCRGEITAITLWVEPHAGVSGMPSWWGDRVPVHTVGLLHRCLLSPHSSQERRPAPTTWLFLGGRLGMCCSDNHLNAHRWFLSKSYGQGGFLFSLHIDPTQVIIFWCMFNSI